MGGSKDDFFIYGSDGKLAIHLPAHGVVETSLSTPEGYANMRDLIVVTQ